MSGKNTTFDDKKNRKSTFYKNKKINNIEDIDANNILISKNESYGNKNLLKYFIGYNDNDIIRPLCIRLPQMTGYARKFEENVTMSFIVKDKQLLRNYTKIWEKTEKLMKINFESNPVYGNDIATFLLALLVFLYYFHNDLLLYLVLFLCFFDNKLYYSFFSI